MKDIQIDAGKLIAMLVDVKASTYQSIQLQAKILARLENRDVQEILNELNIEFPAVYEDILQKIQS